MSLEQAIVGQFKKPRGALGHIAGWIMATRGSNRERNAWTVGLLDIQPRDRVLEVGCGPGLGLAACAARAHEGRVVGLDHSSTMLAQARARNRRAIAASRVELKFGDLAAAPASIGAFDKIFSINVVQFFPDRAGAFAALFAALVQGGTIATTYMPRHRHPTRADAERMAVEIGDHMMRSGFVAIRTETLDLKPVPAICVLGRRPLERVVADDALQALG